MVGNILHPSSVCQNSRCLCKESQTASLHRGEQVHHQNCPREVSQQRDTEQREADHDMVGRGHDHKEDGDADVSLKSGEITEDGAEHKRDDEVFQDSMCDPTTDDPSHTRD